MDTTGLLKAWRDDVVDNKKPYLWSDDEALRYMDAAYRMFVRLTGGIADFDSPICAVDIVPTEAVAEIDNSILRVMSATRRSDSHPIDIINYTDIGKMRSSDYGQIKSLVLDDRSGPVRYAVVGMRRGVLRWVQVPEVADVCDMHVYRMPLGHLTELDQEIAEVDEEHHIYLLDWMKHLAYKKQDADSFNPQASATGEMAFRAYCDQVKAEWERYKHKTRVVSYGGL